MNVRQLLEQCKREEFIALDVVAEVLDVGSIQLLRDARHRGLAIVESDGRLSLRGVDAVNCYLDPSGHAQPGEFPGGVYFLSCGRYIKIGVTWNLEQRLEQFQLHNPLPVSVLLYIKTATEPAAYALETKLHNRFGSHWHRGEWFHACPEIHGYIATKGAA